MSSTSWKMSGEGQTDLGGSSGALRPRLLAQSTECIHLRAMLMMEASLPSPSVRVG